MTSPPLPLASARRTPVGWRVAQLVALAALVALVVGLWTLPEATTALFWRGIVPLVPVLLLIHPTIWRNVCPLATLSIAPDSGRAGGAEGPREAPGDDEGLSFWPPALLLLVLIALRPLGLDRNGPASATLLMGLGTAAVLGRSRRRKSGFCNRYCPVLAVERLYGQSPLLAVGNARCGGCSRCTSRGCLDLSPQAATAQLLGPRRRLGGWLRTPLGFFAAIFPGIILAFNTLPPDPSIARVVVSYAGWGVASGLATGVVVSFAQPTWRTAFRGLGALSAGLYLGFALPDVARVWGWPGAGPAVQLAGVAFALGWFVHGARGRPRLV